jgi:hypothetical protein
MGCRRLWPLGEPRLPSDLTSKAANTPSCDVSRGGQVSLRLRILLWLIGAPRAVFWLGFSSLASERFAGIRTRSG